jgi:hypothetical protein
VENVQKNDGLRHIISSRAADKLLPGHGNREDNGEIFAEPRADKMLPGHGNSEDNGEIFAQPRADKMLPGHGNREDNGEIFAQPRAERDGRVANSPHTHTQHRSDTDRQTQNCTQRRTTRDR